MLDESLEALNKSWQEKYPVKNGRAGDALAAAVRAMHDERVAQVAYHEALEAADIASARIYADIAKNMRQQSQQLLDKFHAINR